MEILTFFSNLLVCIVVVTIAMMYLRRTTRSVIIQLCRSDAAAEFWLRSADVLAYSGSLMLVLIFGKTTNTIEMVEALRTSLILTLSGIFVTVAFVAKNVWHTVSKSPGEPS